MLADLDLLLTAVFCTADDLLPERAENARRRVTDAEVVTLCVAQAVMNISSDREFLAVCKRRLGHLFPELPHQPGYHKRRRRLTETIEWLIGVFAADSPGHSRGFWGMRLHLCCAPDGTPRAAILAPADQPEREVALRLLPIALHGGEQIVCDKGYVGQQFAAEVEARFGAEILRPNRKDEPASALHLSSIRQRIESVFWTLKDRLGLERHRARTLAGLRARIASKLLALAAGVWLNRSLGLPSRAFAQLAR
jgi:Transposase DDE domain